MRGRKAYIPGSKRRIFHDSTMDGFTPSKLEI